MWSIQNRYKGVSVLNRCSVLGSDSDWVGHLLWKLRSQNVVNMIQDWLILTVWRGKKTNKHWLCVFWNSNLLTLPKWKPRLVVKSLTAASSGLKWRCWISNPKPTSPRLHEGQHDWSSHAGPLQKQNCTFTNAFYCLKVDCCRLCLYILMGKKTALFNVLTLYAAQKCSHKICIIEPSSHFSDAIKQTAGLRLWYVFLNSNYVSAFLFELPALLVYVPLYPPDLINMCASVCIDSN